MATKYIFFTKESRDAIKVGIDKITSAIAVSLGVKGKCVIVHDQLGNKISKDGYFISKSINLEHEIEKIGAGFVKEVSKHVVDSAGDGSSSVCVILREMVNQGLLVLDTDEKINSIQIKSGIDKATAVVVDNIKAMSQPVAVDSPKLIQVATISANNDEEIGKMVADVYAKIGKYGKVHIKGSNSFETYSEVVAGYQFDRGLISPLFVSDNTSLSCQLKNPYILICDGKISRWQDIVELVDKIYQQKRSLLIIAEDVEGEALQNLIVNKVRGGVSVAVVRSPSFGETRKEKMDDIAVLTGATYISEERGHKLSTVDLSMLGNCVEVNITKDSTTIIKGNGSNESLQSRVGRIKTQIEQSKSPKEADIHYERLSKINGGVGIIYVGAASETELSEKIDRIDDAVRATGAAIEEGVVVGAGTSLIRSIPMLDAVKTDNKEEAIGVEIVKKSLESILRQICENAGENADEIIEKVKCSTWNIGYNAKTSTLEDLELAGVLDATKVVRVAFENSAYVACTIITTDFFVVNTE